MDLKVAGRRRELAHHGANLRGAIRARHFGDTCHRSSVRSWSPVVPRGEGGVLPEDGGADKHGRTLQMALMGPAGIVCSSGKSAIFQPFQPVWDRQDVYNLHMINRGWKRWRETHTQKSTNTSQGRTPSWHAWCHLICSAGPKSEIWTQNEDESKAQVWQQYLFIYLTCSEIYTLFMFLKAYIRHIRD